MTDMNRRKINKIIGIAVAAPITSLTTTNTVQANELDPESAAAKGLKFVTESDKPDMNCSKCNFFSAIENTDKGSCIVFGAAEVPQTGWCTAYQPKK